jgi:hypothetical protein
MASEDDETSTLARRQLGRLMRDLRLAQGFHAEWRAVNEEWCSELR